MSRFSVLAVAGLLIIVAGCGSASQKPTPESSQPVEPTSTALASSSSERSASPSVTPSIAPSMAAAASGQIEPADFTSTVDNARFPLVPGTVFTYRGTKDGHKAVEIVTVTGETKILAGVTCVVIEDKVSLAGVPAERLLGYYAQDRGGNVWYFGEDDEELDNGQVVSTEGSWHAGVDKAPPALFMEASPTVGKSFAHDYTKSDFAVLSLADKVTVPFGAFTDALVTKEWSPVEPDVETHKFYVGGVGLVRDVAVKGPTEEFVLVKVERP
jgi:hypothetical protein